ncbi:Protein of unknown function, partial [Gryllus bimaculatus]
MTHLRQRVSVVSALRMRAGRHSSAAPSAGRDTAARKAQRGHARTPAALAPPEAERGRDASPSSLDDEGGRRRGQPPACQERRYSHVAAPGDGGRIEGGRRQGRRRGVRGGGAGGEASPSSSSAAPSGPDSSARSGRSGDRGDSDYVSLEDARGSLPHSPELPPDEWTRHPAVDCDAGRAAMGPAEQEIWAGMERQPAPVNAWLSSLVPCNRFHPRVLSPGAAPMDSIREEADEARPATALFHHAFVRAAPHGDGRGNYDAGGLPDVVAFRKEESNDITDSNLGEIPLCEKQRVDIRKLNESTGNNNIPAKEEKTLNQLNELFFTSDAHHNNKNTNNSHLLGVQEAPSMKFPPYSVFDCANEVISVSEKQRERSVTNPEDMYVDEELSETENKISDRRGGEGATEDSLVPLILIEDIDEFTSSRVSPGGTRLLEGDDESLANGSEGDGSDTSVKNSYRGHVASQGSGRASQSDGEYASATVQSRNENFYDTFSLGNEIFNSLRQETNAQMFCSPASFQSNKKLPSTIVDINQGSTDPLDSERNTLQPLTQSTPPHSINFVAESFLVAEWPRGSSQEVVSPAIRVSQWKQFWDQKATALRRKEDCKGTSLKGCAKRSSSSGPPNSPQRRRLHPSIRIPGIVSKWRQAFEHVVHSNQLGEECLQYKPAKKRKSILKQHWRDDEQSFTDGENLSCDSRSPKNEKKNRADFGATSFLNEPKVPMTLVRSRKQSFEALFQSPKKRTPEHYFKTVPPRRGAANVTEWRKFWDQNSKGRSCGELACLASEAAVVVTDEIFVDEPSPLLQAGDGEVTAGGSGTSQEAGRGRSQLERANALRPGLPPVQPTETQSSLPVTAPSSSFSYPVTDVWTHVDHVPVSYSEK